MITVLPIEPDCGSNASMMTGGVAFAVVSVASSELIRSGIKMTSHFKCIMVFLEEQRMRSLV
jgi:hypothetical protein